ncbi:MAG: tetratricopeptide repeat protein [PVC group bacterium]
MGTMRNAVARFVSLSLVFLLTASGAGAGEKSKGDASYDEKVESLQKAIEEDPGSLENYIELWKLYDKQRDCDRVAELYEIAVKSNPDDPKVYMEFYYTFHRCRDKDKALELAQKAAELSPEDPREHFLIGKWLMRISRNKAIAINHLREAVKLQPENDEAHYLLGRAYLESGDPGSALDHLERARELPTFGDNIKGYLHLSSPIERAKECSKLERLCEVGSSDWKDYNELAGYYTGAGQTDKAEKVLRKALAHIKEQSYAYRELGNIFSRQDKYNEAHEAFQEALRIASSGTPDEREDTYRIYEDIGDAYKRMGKPEEALSAYIESIELKSEGRRLIHEKMGDIYIELGKYTEAAPEYGKAGYLIKCARAYRASKNYESAVGVLWGKILEESGSAERPSGADRGAVDKDGKPVKGLHYKVDPQLYLELGKTYQEMGQNGKAVLAYWEALRLNPSSEEAGTAIEVLTRRESPQQP